MNVEYSNQTVGRHGAAASRRRLKGEPNKKLLRTSWPALFISSLVLVLVDEMFKNRLAPANGRSIRETTG